MPGIPRVLRELISANPGIVHLLGGDWRNQNTREAVAQRRASFKTPEGLGEILREGYRDIYIPDALEINLDALNDPDTLAVVTGQQVGIYGGPVYTWYKALTAILLAKQLEKEYGKRVVPIFWMETADADFDEVNRIGFPSRVDQSHHVVYSPTDTVVGKAVNYYRLSQEIDYITNDINDWLKELPFGDKPAELIKNAYRSGRRISDAFFELMTGLFGESGLVMINPLFPSLAESVATFWEVCLERPEKLNRTFILSSHELSDIGFPLQVRLRDEVLPIWFIDENGVRYRLNGTKEAWKFGYEEADVITDDGLRVIGKDKPLSLSPSVLLRPLLQDWLLPTWIYVGGPSEIAYHAQIGRCYDSLSIPRPLIAPRISVTLVESAAQRLLERQSWSPADVLGGREILLRSTGYNTSLDELFNKGAEQLEGWLARIARAVEEASINMDSEIEPAGNKIKYQWERMKRIASGKIAEKDRVRTDHADKLLDMLTPEGMLQERHDNFLYYLGVNGGGFTDMIMEQADLFKPQHHLIYPEGSYGV
ncbi:MAG: bacillithiol biosynthesis cysteine-adding enzyme BshC [Calditrichaeota bacterium]|nr:bacillithiol biosynthesis cysteine-adding enzyme BshC [Calditrichota bacterium]